MFLVFCPLEVSFFHLTFFKGGLTEEAQRDSEGTLQRLFQAVGMMNSSSQSAKKLLLSMGRSTSLYDSNPSDYKLDWDQWGQRACWWMNSTPRQNPNTRLMTDQTSLENKGQYIVALVLWDLSDLFKSKEWAGSLLEPPFLRLSLNLFFF